jgi:hypothetical protein
MKLIPYLSLGSLVLVTGNRDITQEVIQELIAELAVQGPIRCLIGGNRLEPDDLARSIRRITHEIYKPLEHIYLSRAFTCYQMVELLQETAVSPIPTLVLNLLATFSDESVDDLEAERLLHKCIFQLHRLSLNNRVAISAHKQPNRENLLQILQQQMDKVLEFDSENQELAEQLTLF